MLKQTLRFVVASLLLILLVVPTTLLFGQDEDNLIENFEDSNFEDNWWSYTDIGTVTFSCTSEEPGYASNHALHLAFEVVVDSYPGCGVDIQTNQFWETASGLSFFMSSDQPNLNLNVILSVEDASQTNPDSEGLTPFETLVQTSGNTWEQIILPWSAFTKVDWVGESGIDALDASLVTELLFEVNESQRGSILIDDIQLLSGDSQPVANDSSFDKFALWTGETQLRGINTWQRIVIPDLDGLEFLGSDHVGPPYVQEDFDRLAALGANYVNISGPGLFTERPPYILDEEVEANLDNMLTMISQADMFAVISFRTGPGRSDFTFYSDGAGIWFDESLLVESVWTDQAAQDAWGEMWRYTAERYRDNPIVVGYDLMVEPNGNAFTPADDIYEPEEFYPDYADTTYDWNQFYPHIVESIREVDTNTPLLVGGMSWSAVQLLPYLEPVDDPRIVYMVHQYEPQDDYTHQEELPATITYPGELDLDYDGTPDPFNQSWLEDFLSVIDAYMAEYNVPVSVNEYGLLRWVPGAATFMADEINLFEQKGMNHAFWMWNPIWAPHAAENDDFDFLHGPDPNNHIQVNSSDLIEVIRTNWSLNIIRPSNAVNAP